MVALTVDRTVGHVPASFSHDMFPLPHVPLSPKLCVGTHPKSRRRFAARLRNEIQCNDMIDCVNQLSGCVCRRLLPATPTQLKVLAKLKKSFNYVHSSKSEEVASLHAVLKQKMTRYSDVSSSGGPAPLDLSLLSLPPNAGRCDLMSVLGSEDRLDVQRFEDRLFFSESEYSERVKVLGERNSYTDPSLNDDCVYIAFLQELQKRGMIIFLHSKNESVGVFTVHKKNGKLRLIIDCRKLNHRLRPPKKTPLCSTSAFSEFQIPAGSSLEYSGHDVCDCFYQFGIPVWVSRYLALRPVKASLPGVSRCADGPCGPGNLIFRASLVCPWGSHMPFTGPNLATSKS